MVCKSPQTPRRVNVFFKIKVLYSLHMDFICVERDEFRSPNFSD